MPQAAVRLALTRLSILLALLHPQYRVSGMVDAIFLACVLTFLATTDNPLFAKYIENLEQRGYFGDLAPSSAGADFARQCHRLVCGTRVRHRLGAQVQGSY